MKNKCISLLKIHLMTQLGLNTFKYEKDKKKRLNKILISATITFLAIMLAIYCGGLAYGLVQIGAAEVIPVYALVISSILALVFTMFKANGELFAFKDYDLVMSLPIKVSTIIASRFLSLYLWNTVFTIIIMLPMGSVYGIYEKPAVIFYLMWLISLFTVSLIPTTIAAVFGAVITAVASKFKNANKVITILSFIVIIIISLFAVMMRNTDFNINELQSIGAILSEQLMKVYPLAKIFNKAIVEVNVGAFFLFIGLSIAWYYIFIKVLSFKYKQINTSISTYHMRSNYTVGSMDRGNALGALYKKELKNFFSSTVYVTNIGMGVVMALIFSVVLVVVGPNKLMGYIGAGDILNRIAAFIISAMISMTCTTCVALSLEGKNVWIIKSLPLTPKVIYDSKILVNLTLSIPTAVICAILMIIGLKPDLWNSILIVITPIIYSFFTAVWGIFINNRLGYYDWESETQVVKQSVGSMAGMFGAMIMAAIPAVFVGIVTVFDHRVVTSVVAIAMLVITSLLYKSECNRSIM